MMEIVKNLNECLTNQQEISCIINTDIVRVHMDPEFWYQQHTLESDANNHMIAMVWKDMGGDANRMETYIEFGSLVYKYKHCKGIFARSKLTMDAIRF